MGEGELVAEQVAPEGPWQRQLRREIALHLLATLVVCVVFWLAVSLGQGGVDLELSASPPGPQTLLFPMAVTVMVMLGHIIPVLRGADYPIVETVLWMLGLGLLQVAIFDVLHYGEVAVGRWIFGTGLVIVPLIMLTYLLRVLVPQWRPQQVFKPAVRG